MTPIKIKVREKAFLDIIWNDDNLMSMKLSNLRNKCPCATCFAEQKKWSSSYIPIYTSDQLTINKIEIVGTYALRIEWGDDHTTGIYDFEYLYRLFRNFPVK